MMTNLFFKAQGFSSGRNLPRLDSVKPLIDYYYERGAYGHWIFDANETSIEDRIYKRTLETIAGATVSPTLTEGGLVLSLGPANGLLTDLSDTATQNVTFCGVVKVYPTGIAMLFGDLVPAGDTANNGLGVFTTSTSGNGLLTVKPTKTAAPTTNGINSLSAGMALTHGEYCFIAASINKLTKQCLIYVQQAEQESSASSAFTGTYENPGQKFALGNSRYTGVTNDGSCTFAEVVIFDEALDLNTIKEIATRSKNRLQHRNVIF